MNKIPYITMPLQEWKDTFAFHHPLKVRFSETDMFGHMNNTAPIAYFEEARIEFFKHAGLMENWLKKDGELIPVVADIQCDYIRQVFFDEELLLYVKAASVGNSSAELHYCAVNKKREVCFTGRGTVVQISKYNGKSVPFLNAEKKMLIGSEVFAT
ncbi:MULTISPECIES: acyl-CoA thioesterase [unclassified Metabacillus]|uniref:acyl-CoA thioesterase n=1 Tax=Metabacillus sp. JX24 TaxID=3240759 RepID=UPI0030FD96A8